MLQSESEHRRPACEPALSMLPPEQASKQMLYTSHVRILTHMPLLLNSFELNEQQFLKVSKWDIVLIHLGKHKDWLNKPDFMGLIV